LLLVEAVKICGKGKVSQRSNKHHQQ